MKMPNQAKKQITSLRIAQKLVGSVVLIFVCFQIYERINIGVNGSSIITNLTVLIAMHLFVRVFVRRLFRNKNIQVSVSSIFITLYIVEFFLWLFNINLTYNEVKNGKYYSERTVEVNNWYKTYPPADSVFLDRMPEFVHLSVSYPNGLIDQPQFNNLSHKIIAMGDSFTEGVGAESPEKAWPKQLQKMIREQYDRDGYVMNAGIAGSDPIFCFRLFHDKLVHLKPSIVLLCINESDFRDVAIKGGVERFLPNGNVQYRTTSCLELVYATSYISRLPIKIFTGYDNFFVNNRDYGFAVNAIAACIDSFQHLAKQHHFELVTLFVPTEAELKVPNTNMSQLNHILLAKGYSCLNVRDELIYAINQKNLTASDLYWKEDRHLNSKGYEVLAKIIFDYLRKRAYL